MRGVLTAADNWIQDVQIENSVEKIAEPRPQRPEIKDFHDLDLFLSRRV